MPVQLKDLRDVSASEPNPDRENDCAICLDPFEVDEEIWKHDGCRKSFHADCIRSWYKLNHSCPNCRRYMCYHVHHIQAEELDHNAAQIHEAMLRLIRQNRNASLEWNSYWNRRSARLTELGPEVFVQQPGYIYQQRFHDTVEKERDQHMEETRGAIEQFRQTNPRVGRQDSATQANNSQAGQSTPSEAGPAAVTTRPPPTNEEQAGIARWNIFAARNAAEEDPSSAYEAALEASREKFVEATAKARTELDENKEQDLSKDGWEEDPPNPCEF